MIKIKTIIVLLFELHVDFMGTSMSAEQAEDDSDNSSADDDDDDNKKKDLKALISGI